MKVIWLLLYQKTFLSKLLINYIFFNYYRMISFLKISIQYFAKELLS